MIRVVVDTRDAVDEDGAGLLGRLAVLPTFVHAFRGSHKELT